MAYAGTGSKLQIGKEAAWGTPVAGVKDANILSESIKLNARKEVEDTLIAAKAASGKLLMGLDVSGEFTGILKPENAGYLLHLALGGTDTVQAGVPVVNANTHTIVAAAANGAMPSFTVIVDRRVSIKKYSGCKMQSFRLEGAAGDYVRYTASILGKDEAVGTLAGIALALKSFKTVNATLTIGGTSISAKKVTLNIGNALQEVGQTYGTGLYKAEPIHGTREITIDVELNYETVVDTIDTANYQTDTVVASIVWTMESPSYVTGTTPYKVTVTLNNVVIDGIERNVSGAAIIPARITGTATAVGSTEPITASVVDAQATAYSA